MATGDSQQGPIRLSALIPDFQDRLVRVMELADAQVAEATELDITKDSAIQRTLPVVHPAALMENNLARKGIWQSEPNREQIEFTYTTEDVIGSLTIEYSLGQLSTADMELVSWILGRWRPGNPKIGFALRDYGRACKVAWGGNKSERLKQALHRISRTRFTGRVWEQKSRRHTTRHFGIFDDVIIHERKNSFDGPVVNEEGTVTITLSTFVLEQLEGQQFVRLNWGILRTGLRNRLSRRLYVFLESQRGFSGGTLYEITIDNALIETLGSSDKKNLPRFRAKLQKAGEEIVGADPRYEEVRIRAAAGSNGYVLHVRRKAA